jgi:hypothetical protein
MSCSSVLMIRLDYHYFLLYHHQVFEYTCQLQTQHSWSTSANHLSNRAIMIYTPTILSAQVQEVG